MQRVGHKEEPILCRPVALGLPDRQFLRRQLLQNMVFAVAPNRSARAVERHHRRKADEVDQTGIAHLLGLIAEEMRVAMTLTGVRTVKEITRDNLVKAAELRCEIENRRGASTGARNAA